MIKSACLCVCERDRERERERETDRQTDRETERERDRDRERQRQRRSMHSDRAAASPSDPPVSPTPVLGLEACATKSTFFRWVLGI